METQADKKPTEFIGTFHGQNGTVRIAYRNAESAVRGIIDQTHEGWVCASLIERERQTCPTE